MDLGQKLQFYRRIRRMSLRDVAEKADCSPSFLSQIELDRVSPTVKSLRKICRALGVTPADFLREEALIEGPVVIPTNRERCPVIVEWKKAKLLHFLQAEASSPFTALLLRIEPGGSTPPRHAIYSLKELCIVLKGDLRCHIGQTVYPLATGESIFFDLLTAHSWFNPGQDVGEVLLTSPNSFHLFEQVENDVRWHVTWKRQRRLRRGEKKSPEVQKLESSGGE
jgi:transcriptional regulator with XRE-family HTH domain